MFSFLSFPPIEKHGVIGDRRTAALVAADGTIDWFCAPDYDDHVVFGALLDPKCGGLFRFGPETPVQGEQHYEEKTACLLTRWSQENAELELTDFMPWPGLERPKEVNDDRVILRRFRVLTGEARVGFELRPRGTFTKAPSVKATEAGVQFMLEKQAFALWTSFPLETDKTGCRSLLSLGETGEAWTMFGLNETPDGWNIERCRQLHEDTVSYWHKWTGQLKNFSFGGGKLERTALTVQLLAHAPNNAVVAAVTTSLPERIGGDRNYDYRYTWVRDASLSAAFLAIMGISSEVAKYFDWLCKLDSKVKAPLQVCYRTDGQTKLKTRKVKGVTGYRESQPVQFGNRAYKQRQLGSLGWFADSVKIFLEAGGDWKPEYWDLLERAANFVCRAWRNKDSGVWELAVEAHYVASKLMAWVTLDRALIIAALTGNEPAPKWKKTREAIRGEILVKGWSEERRSFRQRYGAEALDAASLLIPLMDFLPPDDPRVLGTIDAIEDELVVEGLVHRFDPKATLGDDQLPMGAFEGAFLPATFWYAHALVGAGRTKEAAEVLRRCEEIAAGPGLFAEEADAQRKTFLGNTPLLFSQVEYGRALLALHHHQRNESPNE